MGLLCVPTLLVMSFLHTRPPKSTRLCFLSPIQSSQPASQPASSHVQTPPNPAQISHPPHNLPTYLPTPHQPTTHPPASAFHLPNSIPYLFFLSPFLCLPSIPKHPPYLPTYLPTYPSIAHRTLHPKSRTSQPFQYVSKLSIYSPLRLYEWLDEIR